MAGKLDFDEWESLGLNPAPSAEEEPERDLWRSVIWDALYTIRHGRDKAQIAQDRRWLRSEAFEEICGMLGLEPSAVRRQVGL